MTYFYKAIRLDGGSFNDPSFKWDTEVGGVTTHPLYRKPERKDVDGAAGYLSVATVPTDCTGMKWPCRLLWVEPVGRPWTPDAESMPNKRAALRFRTVKELPASDVFGEQDIHVVALINRASRLSAAEVRARDAAWDAARDAAWDAARDAALDAAWDAALDAAWDAALDAALDAAWGAAWGAARGAAWDAARGAGALLVRDLIDTAHYDTLTLPWRTTIGRIHPDDPDV